MCSCEFVVLSLDGSRTVQDKLDDDKPATALNISDHYKARYESGSTGTFEHITLYDFAQHFSMPHDLGDESTRRNRKVVVVVRPYYA